VARTCHNLATQSLKPAPNDAEYDGHANTHSPVQFDDDKFTRRATRHSTQLQAIDGLASVTRPPPKHVTPTDGFGDKRCRFIIETKPDNNKLIDAPALSVLSDERSVKIGN